MGKTIHLYGFPSPVSAEAVKEFLELHTGKGTVYAIKVRQTKNGGPRAYAIVQFTAARYAEHIISLSNQRLWYGMSYLKARKMEQDMVPKPRMSLYRMDNLQLHFGCQISKEKFSTFWTKAGVYLNFGIGMRKLHFMLSHDEVEYKLELSYENIWQIELHFRRGQATKYLLIQVGL